MSLTWEELMNVKECPYQHQEFDTTFAALGVFNVKERYNNIKGKELKYLIYFS